MCQFAGFDWHEQAGKFVGNYARPRRFELAGAINRLRSIAFRQADAK